MPVLATRDTIVNEGDRIAQFKVVRKMDSINFIEKEVLDNEDRQGFGSTGIK